MLVSLRLQPGRKFGSLLALGVLFLGMADLVCSPFVQQMNSKQIACCASKPCYHSAKTEDCCTHMSPDGQQFKAEFSKALSRADLAPATLVDARLQPICRPSAFVELATVEHSPPLPLYTIHRSFLI